MTHAKPWGWKVAAYLWTKSIGAGVALVAAFLLAFGFLDGSRLLNGAAPLLALLFTTITTVLLIWDLKRPERFFYLLFVPGAGGRRAGPRPNLRSWLTRGAWCLIGLSTFTALWLLAYVSGLDEALPPLWWLSAVGAIAAAGYTAFLFGQAEGRDLWQSPLYLWHLLAAEVAAGAAVLLLGAALGGEERGVLEAIARVLAVGTTAAGLIALAEVFSHHPTADAARAAHELAFGRFRLPYWLGAILLGAVLPPLAAVLYLAVDAPAALPVAGALAALAGLAAFEWAWVEAGQVVPLS